MGNKKEGKTKKRTTKSKKNIRTRKGSGNVLSSLRGHHDNSWENEIYEAYEDRDELPHQESQIAADKARRAAATDRSADIKGQHKILESNLPESSAPAAYSTIGRRSN